MTIINYGTIATDIGLQKLRNAAILKQPLDLEKVKFGDSLGSEYSPTGSEKDLKNVVFECEPNYIIEDGVNETWNVIESVIPHDKGPWWVREMGVFDSEGDLIFICAIAPRYKPVSDSTSVDMSFETTIDILNSGAINFIIDPHTALATKNNVVTEIGLRSAKDRIRVLTCSINVQKSVIKNSHWNMQLSERIRIKDTTV